MLNRGRSREHISLFRSNSAGIRLQATYPVEGSLITDGRSAIDGSQCSELLHEKSSEVRAKGDSGGARSAPGTSFVNNIRYDNDDGVQLQLATSATRLL